MTKTFILKILRGTSGKQYWEEFELAHRDNASVISSLMEIRNHPVNRAGESVAPVLWDDAWLEKSCRSCSILVNGAPRKACDALINPILAETASDTISLAPLSKLPLICDLIVDRTAIYDSFFDRIKMKIVALHRLWEVIKYLLSCRKQIKSVIVHHECLVSLPPSISIRLLSKKVKNKLTCPSDMTIVMVHNYKKPPLMEKSLIYAGIKGYKTLSLDPGAVWNGLLKIKALNDYVQSGACKTKYLFYCDSRDALIVDDLGKAIEALEQSRSEMLFSATSFESPYYETPKLKIWSNIIAAREGFRGSYINAGVFIAEVDFLKKFLPEVLKFKTDKDLTTREYEHCADLKILRKILPNYPYGVGSDQVIIRCIHPQFYPRIKIDYARKIAIR